MLKGRSYVKCYHKTMTTTVIIWINKAGETWVNSTDCGDWSMGYTLSFKIK